MPTPANRVYVDRSEVRTIGLWVMYSVLDVGWAVGEFPAVCVCGRVMFVNSIISGDV